MTVVLALLPYLASLALLLCLSAFFSGSETALFSLSRTQARRMSRGTRPEQRATQLLDDPQHLLSTILIGNLLVNIAIASIIASLSQRFLQGHGVLVAILISSAALLIFGEVTPKTIAAGRSRAFAAFVAIPLSWLSYALAPFRILLRWTSDRILRLFGVRMGSGWTDVTRDEIDAMLALGVSSGIASKQERQLAQRILDLPEIDAHSLMVPRTDVDGLDDTETLREAYRTLCERQRSRMPVFADNIDQTWGFLSLADLPRWRDSGQMGRPLSDWRPADSQHPTAASSPVYPVSLVPEGASVERVLGTMRERGTQLVLLLDEYGGTAGLLTMHGILAELLGYLSPQHEAGHKAIVRSGNQLRVDGKMPVRELNRELQPPITAGEADTVGGYVTAQMERIPRAGDKMQDDNYGYRVVQMTGRRVGVVEIEPLPTDVSATEMTGDA